MIKVEALIRPQKMYDVKAALAEIGVRGMTFSEARGTGREKGPTLQHRGVQYRVELVQRIKVEIVVQDGDADFVADTIAAAACTGTIGDGRIFLSPVCETIRICTGEHGRVAIL